jgi:hypothetical protein
MLPIRIGAFACASTRGAAKAETSAAPAPAEFLMNILRENRLAGEFCLFMAALPRPPRLRRRPSPY